MISIEDYENMFALFEAEQELISSLLNPNIITEGFNDKVTSYVNKVLQSTQKSWDRFNKKVATEKDKKFLDSNQKLLTSNNIRTFNIIYLKAKFIIRENDDMESVLDNIQSIENILKLSFSVLVISFVSVTNEISLPKISFPR